MFGRRSKPKTSSTTSTTTPRGTSGGWWSGNASDGLRNKDLSPRPGEDTRRWRRDSLGRQS